MSLNLGQLFDRARALVDQAIDSAGTTVTFSRTVTTRNPDTLEATDATSDAATVPALVVVLGASDLEPVPGIPIRAGDWRIVCKYAAGLAPSSGELVTVASSRDPRLVGRVADVSGTVVDSTAALTTVYARPRYVSG